MYKLTKDVKNNVVVKDNVTVDVVDMGVVAHYLKLSIPDAEECIKKGLDPSHIPGAVKRQSAHNIVTNVGLDLLLARLKDSDTVTAKITHFAVGTSNAAPAASDTTLGTEVYRDTVTQYVYTSVGVITLKCYVPTAYPASQPVTLKETGLFNADTNGSLFARVLFSPTVSKNNTISMIINWVVTATT